MRKIGILALAILSLVFFNVISLQTIGTLALLMAAGIGLYILFYTLIAFLALGLSIVGVIAAISLITYATTNLI
ncbi:hypothetical protein R6231_14510 [Bacillus cytotoxicus]|uniref:hypothetical protein n=1 Tax=Bacillus cereus group TaxID=86661 RepID=UPI000B96524E|nr:MULTISPECIES: hypothetical protein [Bacillus cereus group]AWC31006.1 hypothetical protein CG483_022570 [Bacillus cytotoxicus]AWC35046.1 hypothetical protein CG482_022575 [Bacillus cytotoxicus]AWC39085.1 hypothetical protein CG481_022580 [Bacillus cytotoxicus]AWC43098.1 hypothetical protein CG480_022405 [Bacillus cytotoxicus]AWC46989.1 hypothetical protein CG479_021545 [Bacillus cytotoxicus]